MDRNLEDGRKNFKTVSDVIIDAIVKRDKILISLENRINRFKKPTKE